MLVASNDVPPLSSAIWRIDAASGGTGTVSPSIVIEPSAVPYVIVDTGMFAAPAAVAASNGSTPVVVPPSDNRTMDAAGGSCSPAAGARSP